MPDFAVPVRCGGCGTVVDEIDSFCTDCWKQTEWLGVGGSSVRALPLKATDPQACAACLARPPRLARMRAAVAYCEISCSIALKLKRGRKVAPTRMARYMALLVAKPGSDAAFVPVPLHRRRFARRGFSQWTIVARELSRRLNVPLAVGALKRVKATPPLKGLSMVQRRRTVSDAFSANPKAHPVGRTVILVDDVLTSGSTANACARALKQAGAARTEFVSWASAVRPRQIV